MTQVDERPVAFCCPPGTHNRIGRCLLNGVSNSFDPQPEAWFSQSFIHSALHGLWPFWSVTYGDTGAYMRLKTAARTYIWRLTDEYRNDGFLRLGRWPD